MNCIQRIIKKRWKWLSAVSIVLFIFILIPVPRFDDPVSTVVFSADNKLLGARVAADGQWRFPPADSFSVKYQKAVIAFEDQWFFYHPGVNPVSLLRAAITNFRHKRIVSGGSTLTMQVARMSGKNRKRTIGQKIIEMCMAVKLSLLKPKQKVLQMYASNAPFGGNVVGVDAAAWRYFSRAATNLSWAEAATLAVLPNSPALIYPGRNEGLLKNKRDRLLKKLLTLQHIDSLTYKLALAEPLPVSSEPLPQHAYHIVENCYRQYEGQNVVTSIDYDLQKNVNRIVKSHSAVLAKNHIYNLAAIVVEVESGNIMAYTGNVPGLNTRHSGHVDIVRAPRSTGSILKPFLYAAMLQSGDLLPDMLLRDVPVNYAGYSPQNFDYTYSGAVPASEALSRSLNIPAVEMLQTYGEARFLDLLRKAGFHSFNQSAEHYGLSLILGGGETSLFELAGVYSSMARVLHKYNQYGGYNPEDIHQPKLIAEKTRAGRYTYQPVFSASAVWFTFAAMEEVNRPDQRTGWWNFTSARRVAWKTGTSFGFRDAWAVAITSEYVIAVWAGNANGEGRSGLTGSSAAAPVVFDIVDLLPSKSWFEMPADEITYAKICAESGHKASPRCPHVELRPIPVDGIKTRACPYHKLIHLSSDRLFRVNSSCYPVQNIVVDSAFILPPAMEWYFRKLNPDYKILPPLMKGCVSALQTQNIELLYPRNLAKIYVPVEMDGKRGRVIFEAAHRFDNARIYWHLNNQYVGQTKKFHQMALLPNPGRNVITLIDEDGNSLQKTFYTLDSALR
jgi:penicillin-binding protein 1C